VQHSSSATPPPRARIVLARALCLALAASALQPTTACADDGAGDGDGLGLQWSSRHTRFTTTQYALTLGLAGGVVGTFLLPERTQPVWQSGILLDADARSLLAGRNRETRRAAGVASDWLQRSLLLYPFLIDSLMVAGVVHGSADVAFQMSMINLQAVLITQLVTGLTKHLFGRARPDVSRCTDGDTLSCGEQNMSFMSGHTSSAFVGAGLICAHHENLALYGDGPGGAVACGLALAAAGSVGTLRVVADRHHLSDVLAGAAVGLTAGYLLPNILNYDFGLTRKLSRQGGRVYPMVGRDTLGLGYLQTF
jgi:membrane-associated phospholipid phosphatase